MDDGASAVGVVGKLCQMDYKVLFGGLAAAGTPHRAPGGRRRRPVEDEPAWWLGSRTSRADNRHKHGRLA